MQTTGYVIVSNYSVLRWRASTFSHSLNKVSGFTTPESETIYLGPRCARRSRTIPAVTYVRSSFFSSNCYEFLDYLMQQTSSALY